MLDFTCPTFRKFEIFGQVGCRTCDTAHINDCIDACKCTEIFRYNLHPTVYNGWESKWSKFCRKLLLLYIKILFTLGLERKIYRNEMITGKDKKVTQASHSRASGLQARLLETFSPKNAKAPRRKHRKLAHLLLWI